MKKALLFLVLILLLTLAGCSKEESKEQNTTERHINEEQLNEKRQEELEKKIKQNHQLANLITDVVSRYGIVSKNYEYQDNYLIELGLVYADLIDFNNDGQDELYLLMTGSEFFNAESINHNQHGYVEEIWGFVDEELVRLWNFVYPLYGIDSEIGSTLVTMKDKKVAIQQTSYFGKQGVLIDGQQFYTLENNQFLLADKFEYVENYNLEPFENAYLINDEEVDQLTYESELEKYNGTEKVIISLDERGKEFAIDLSNPSKQIEKILDDLLSNANIVLLESETIPINVSLENAIQLYRNIANIDVRDPNTYQYMITGLIFNQLVKSDTKGEYNQDAFTEQSIKEGVNKYFNVDLDIASLGLPSDTSEFSWLYYKDGKVELPATDIYPYINYRFIDKVVLVSENLYYAKVYDYTLDYQKLYEQHNLDFSRYENIPINELPENVKSYLESEIPTYLLLKQEDDYFQLLYQSHLNLLDEEFKEFE